MKRVKLAYRITPLLRILVCGPCILAASSLMENVAPPTNFSPFKVLPNVSSPTNIDVYLIDKLLENPRITLSDGKILQVVLEDDLKDILLNEKNTKSKKFTNLFEEYFEMTKLSKVSDKVIGFHFLLEGESIYRVVFLGRNAR